MSGAGGGATTTADDWLAALSGTRVSDTLRPGEVSVAVVMMLLHGEFRHRWRSWVAGALLVGLVSGLVLAGVATARRTATAFPRYEAAHGFDAFFYSAAPVPRAVELPEVTSAVEVQSPATGPPSCACTHAINLNDFAVDEVQAAQQARMFKLVAGRLPDQSRPDEVLASFTLQQDLGVHVGTVIRLAMASRSQRTAVLEDQNIVPAGPRVVLRVVGIEASEYEFPASISPSFTLYTTQAFARAYNPRSVLFDQYFVSLRHKAASLPEFENQARTRGAVSFSTSTPSVPRSIRRSSPRWSGGGS